MTGRATKLVWLVLLALACGAAVYWIVPHLLGDWVEEEQEVGLRGEAAVDPYLALARFLDKMGIATESRTTIVSMPPEGTALLLLAPRFAFGKDRTRKVLDWVDRGGHLLVAPATKRPPTQRKQSFGWFQLEDPEEEALHDPLLDELAIEHGEKLGEAEAGKVRFKSPSLELELLHSVRTRLEVDEQDLDVLWSCWDSAVASRRACVAVSLRHGIGTITVVHDRMPFTNLALGEHDHAAYTWELIKRFGDLRRAWIVRGDALPGLWSQLLSWLWPALIGLALLLAAGLWRAWVRIGPVEDPESGERRSLEEHLLASGRFAWASGDREQLLVPMRAALVRRIRTRHQQLLGKPETELVGRVAELTSLPEAQVRAALITNAGSSHDHFVRAVQYLERIRSRT